MFKYLSAQLKVTSLALVLVSSNTTNISAASISLPSQGIEAGEYGYLYIEGTGEKKDLQIVLQDKNRKVLWTRELESGESSSAIPFIVPEPGEYEIQLRSSGKWLIRLHLLVENSRLWAGESLHEAALNMLGILRTKQWFGSPATNLPSDDPKFVTWVLAKEQDILKSVTAKSPSKKTSGN